MVFTSLLLAVLASPASASERAAELPRFECRPEIIEAFTEAWLRSDSGRKDYEAAFRADRADGIDGGYTIEFIPMTFDAYKLPVQYSLSKTVAIAHTHPNSALPTPGPGDFASKVPNYVISEDALYVTIPGTRNYRFVRRNWARPCS